ncbi:Heme d1 biosynthesis protein NirJ [Minicystis rosea]|nr:Heme d1 biosynthesis protein NirJ [Minicystis rosea]
MVSGSAALPAPGEPAPRPAGSIFRDPPPAEAEAQELQAEIARILVRAPRIPIDLPAFRLSLLGVHTDGKLIDLIIGKSSPIARLRLRPATASAGGLVTLGAKRPRVVSAAVEAIHGDTQRFRSELDSMADRVSASIDQDRWSAALAVAKRLRRVPSGVPLEHFRLLVPGVTHPLGLVRVGFTCNQDCGLCWQDRDWGRFDAAQVITWIEDLHAAGARELIISGGEPTLDPELERYIRHARALGFHAVTLETNAVQIAKPGVADKLREAGLAGAFVSLHAGDAAVSDAVTRAPGTFVRTVKGVQNLLAADIEVRLNAVMVQEVLANLAALPDVIHEAFGAHPKLRSLMLSLPAEPFDRALLPDMIPDPAILRSLLPKAIDRAFALGIAVRGLDGPCGPQLCAYGADPRVTRLDPVPDGELHFRRHLPACDGCVVRHACFGPRTAQVERYGDACVAPITKLPDAASDTRPR